MSDFPTLLSPMDVGPVTLANRCIMGSMHTGFEETGDWARLAAFYAARAQGGAGLIVTGGIAPNAEGGVVPGAAGLATEAEIGHHRQVVEAVHAQGGKIVMQILHAGRYAYSKAAVAPSAIRAPISPFVPTALDEAGIEKQITDFVTTAENARKAGYDGVEIMGSEGYLISQFLNQGTNRREDDWGGDFTARSRFPREIVRRCRAALGADFLIMFRLSLLDLVPGAPSWAEILQLGQALAEDGADLFNTGIGWHESRVPTIATSVPRAAFRDVTARFRRETGLITVAANRINTPALAEDILAKGEADLVSLARPWLADEAFVAKAASGQADRIAPCIACNQACLDHTFQMKPATCLVNPRAGHEQELTITPTDKPRQIAVVGAGPAGLSAALTLDQRGHAVTLFEAKDRVGGLLHFAAAIPGKEEFQTLIAWYEREVAASSLTLRLGMQARAADLDGFDEIVLATGARPRPIALANHGGPQLCSYEDILSGRVVAGPRVAIIGAGGIGFDVAEFLVEEPPSPTMDMAEWSREWGVCMPWQADGGLAPDGPAPQAPARQVWLMQRKSEKLGKRLGKTTGWIHRASLRAKGVHSWSGCQYDRLEDGALVVTRDGKTQPLAVDTVVVAAGQLSERGLWEDLQAANRHAHLIGAADVVTEVDAKRAIDQAVRLAAEM